MQYTSHYHFALPDETDDQWGDAVNDNFTTADGFAFAGAYCDPPIVALYAGSTDPEGWLICDGRAISRTEYADLFAAIGTTYGAGDNSTTFAIPDLRGRFACGASQDQSLGTTGGTNTVTLDVVNLAAHTHTVTMSEVGTHTHTASYEKQSSGDGAEVKAQIGDDDDYQTTSISGNSSVTTSFSGKHTHSSTVGDAGSNPATAHENRPLFLTLNYIIKT